MSWLGRSRAVMAVAAVAVVVTTARADDGQGPGEPRWVSVQGDHPERARLFGQVLERQVVEFMTLVAPDLGVRAGEGTLIEVRLFDSQDDYETRAEVDGFSVAGAYSSAGKLVAWVGRSDVEPLRMLRHETAHHLVAWAATGNKFSNYNSAPVPHALDEGLAEVFEAGGLQSPNLEHLSLLDAALRRRDPPHLATVLGLGDDIPRAPGAGRPIPHSLSFSGGAKPEAYALSYAVARFLLADSTRRALLSSHLFSPDRLPDQAEATLALWRALVAQAGGADRLRRQWLDCLAWLADEWRHLEAPAAVSVQARALVARLGTRDFAERVSAHAALQALGPQALPVLRDSLAAPDPEVRTRVLSLVRKALGVGRGNWWSGSAVAE